MASCSTSTSEVRLTVPAQPENVAVIRHVMGAFGESMGLSRDTMEDVRLAVTEACTNVVRHAYDHRGGLIDVCNNPAEDRLEVTVADTGRGIGSSFDRDGPGFGLPMMATLADSLEIHRTVHAGSRIAMAFNRVSEPAGAA